MNLRPLYSFLALLPLAAPLRSDEPVTRHVILISVDGLRADALQAADAPNIKQAASEGCYSWRAQTISPSRTMPAHASMLTGVSPDKHQVVSNHWYFRQWVLPTPTVLSLARASGCTTAAFVGKQKMTHLARADSLNPVVFPGPTRRNNPAVAWFDLQYRFRDSPWKEATDSITLAITAANYAASHHPNLMFVHLADPDLVGHVVGWMTPAQMDSIHRTDTAVGILREKIRNAPDMSDAVFILTSDHGGHKLGHGTTDAEDMIIPWVCWGHRILTGHEIAGRVAQCDNAPTILSLMGLRIPSNVDGRAVSGIVVPVNAPVESQVGQP